MKLLIEYRFVGHFRFTTFSALIVFLLRMGTVQIHHQNIPTWIHVPHISFSFHWAHPIDSSENYFHFYAFSMLKKHIKTLNVSRIVTFYTLDSVSYKLRKIAEGYLPSFFFHSFPIFPFIDSTLIVDLIFGAKLNFHVTHLLQIGWPVLVTRSKPRRIKRNKKKKDEIPNVCGCFISGCHWWRVLSKNHECSLVGTQRNCGYLRRNTIQEFIYKCRHCSAIAQGVNVPFAEQQLVINFFAKLEFTFLKNRYWSNFALTIVRVCIKFTILIEFKKIDLFSSGCGWTDLFEKER